MLLYVAFYGLLWPPIPSPLFKRQEGAAGSVGGGAGPTKRPKGPEMAPPWPCLGLFGAVGGNGPLVVPWCKMRSVSRTRNSFEVAAGQRQQQQEEEDEEDAAVEEQQRRAATRGGCVLLFVGGGAVYSCHCL